nr:hypothetical protein [uncultured Desulfosarcina sp.]
MAIWAQAIFGKSRLSVRAGILVMPKASQTAIRRNPQTTVKSRSDFLSTGGCKRPMALIDSANSVISVFVVILNVWFPVSI